MTIGKKGGRPTKAQAAEKAKNKPPAPTPEVGATLETANPSEQSAGGAIPLPPFPEQDAKNKGGRPTKEQAAEKAKAEQARLALENQARLEPCKQEAKMFCDLTFSLVAMWRGPIWKLGEAEWDALGNAVGPVLAKYPDVGGAYRVEITAAVGLAVVVMAKLSQEAAIRASTRLPQPDDAGPVAPVSPLGGGAFRVRQDDNHKEAVPESTEVAGAGSPG